MGTVFSPFQFARLPYWVIPPPTGFPATKAKNISFPVWASTGASHGPRLHDLALLLTVPHNFGKPQSFTADRRSGPRLRRSSSFKVR
jgi:hypothetical protein